MYYASMLLNYWNPVYFAISCICMQLMVQHKSETLKGPSANAGLYVDIFLFLRNQPIYPQNTTGYIIWMQGNFVFIVGFFFENEAPNCLAGLKPKK